jgi:hypothetical protein
VVIVEICLGIVDILATCDRCGHREEMTVRDQKFYDQMKFEKVI